MLQPKLIKTMVAMSVASVIAQAHAIDVSEVQYKNEDVASGNLVIRPTNENFINNGFIQGQVNYDNPPDTATTNPQMINVGTIGSGTNLTNFAFNQTGTFYVKRDITNYGLTKSKRFLNVDQIYGSDANMVVRNLGRSVNNVFLEGDIDTKTTNNYGLIKSNKYLLNSVSGNFVNYGVVDASSLRNAPNGPYGSYENKGVQIINGKAEIGSGGVVNIDGIDMTISNGYISNEHISSWIWTEEVVVHGTDHQRGHNITHQIINGDVFKVDDSTPVKVTESIFNATLDFSKNNAKTIIISDSIYNGSDRFKNIDIDYHPDTKVDFKGKSVINGDLFFKNINGDTRVENNNYLGMDNTVILNGDIDGDFGNKGKLNTYLTINNNPANPNANLKVFHNIRNLASMNVAGKTTIYETANFENVKNINIQKGADLVLRVDTTKRDTVSNDITGHALYNNVGVLASNGGKLIVDALPTDPTQGEIINFGGTTLATSVNNKNIAAASTLVNYEKISDNQIKVSIKQSLPTLNEYEQIYDAILNSGNVVELGATSNSLNGGADKANERVYWTLEQIYSANPYGYTMKANRDSLKLFTNALDYQTIMPRQGENILTARAIYTGNRADNYASGKGHYTEKNLKTSSNAYGTVISNEYGLDNKSVGMALGYNRQDVDFKGLSKIKNNNFYAGLFLKNRFGNFLTKIGADYQFTRSNIEHNIVNDADRFENKAKVTNHTASAYLEGKYAFNFGEHFSLAPVAKVAYYYVHQGDIDEGQGRLATKVKKANLNLVDVEGGLDLAFRNYLFGGSLKQVLHLGAVGTFGDTEKTLYGSFLPSATGGANEYYFKGATIPKVMGKVGYRIEYETLSKFIYSIGGNYQVGKQNQNFDANVGLGYKF